jgi:hypothetical protein
MPVVSLSLSKNLSTAASHAHVPNEITTMNHGIATNCEVPNC